MKKLLKMSALFLALGLLTFVACKKEENNNSKEESNASLIEQNRIAVKKHLLNSTTVQSLRNLQGGSIDDVLQNVENVLNLAHGYADQSIGEISVTEAEFTVPNNCSNTEAEAIYENALSLWSNAYQSFNGENRQAILIDLEKLDQPAENGDARVKVSAWVGASQEDQALPPCNGVTFSTGTYELYKPSAANIKWYAGNAITIKLNAKLYKNSCAYYENTKEFPWTSENRTIQVSGKRKLNEIEMVDYYCQILTFIQGLNLPTGYSIQSVDITSDILVSPNPNGKFDIKSVKIGILKYKTPPCNVVPPLEK
jgi:hypothetical protein